MSSKKTIAIDIDDVIAANAKGFIAWSNKTFGTNLTDYDEHWQQLWQANMDEHQQRVKRFYSDKVLGSYEHFDEAVSILKELKKDYLLVITTSRARVKNTDAITKNWLDKYFPDLFDDIHYAGIWDEVTENSIKMTKAKLCEQVEASYLIDDQLKHCYAAAEAGIKALLFGDYSWNKAAKLPRNVHRVKNWQEVKEFFENEK